MDADDRRAGLDLLFRFGEDFVHFGEDDLVRDGVAAEEIENVGVFLFDAVFAVDEDKSSTESG